MELAFVGAMKKSDEHLMVLREKNGDRALIMGIGPAEAAAIAMGVEGIRTPRPMTHDLILELLDRLHGQLTRGIIHDVRGNAFIGVLDVDTQRGVLEVDCRPSDAVALAVRVGAPIFASDHVLERAAIRIHELDDGQEWID